jgi:hypothetical protein
MRDGAELTRRGKRRAVNRKWPRWLVPNCISKPSAVRASGHAMTPALLTRTSRRSMRASNSSAEVRMLSRSARSTCWKLVAPPISSTTARPLASSRPHSTTRAPADANARADSLPSPLVAPVTAMVRPLRSRPATTSSVVVSTSKAIRGPYSALGNGLPWTLRVSGSGIGHDGRQLVLPESVNVWPAMGTNCQS